MTGSEDSDADGYRLNLEPPGDGWSSFAHRGLVLQMLRDLVWAGGLEWEIEEREYSPEVRAVNWICPEQEHCWLCIEYRDGKAQLIQASFPEVDSRWSLQLASAVVRVIVIFQLSVEA